MTKRNQQYNYHTHRPTLGESGIVGAMDTPNINIRVPRIYSDMRPK